MAIKEKISHARVEVTGDIEIALKKLKNQVNKSGLTQELKKRRYYMKPSEERQMAIKKAIQKRRRQERRTRNKTRY